MDRRRTRLAPSHLGPGITTHQNGPAGSSSQDRPPTLLGTEELYKLVCRRPRGAKVGRTGRPGPGWAGPGPHPGPDHPM